MSDSYFHGLYNKWGFARLLEVSFYRRNFSFCSCITSSDVFCLVATSKLVLSHTAYDPKLCGKLASPQILHCLRRAWRLWGFWNCSLLWWTLHRLFILTCIYNCISTDHHPLRLWSSVLFSYLNYLTMPGNAMQGTDKYSLSNCKD